MKSKLLILFVLLTAHQAYAQLGSGNLLLGGGFGFNTGENNTSLNINPSGHYFISDNISIGGALNLGTNRTNPGEDIYTRTNTFGITPAVRYFKDFGEKVYLYGQASLGLTSSGSTFIDGNERTDIQSTNRFGLGISPGIVYAPNDKIGFDFNFSLISFNRNGITDETDNPATTNVETGFSFAFNSLNPSFGIYYIIGN
ncbi:MAG: outer membrane beta-barrel protein [Bacteroidota bacterium]